MGLDCVCPARIISLRIMVRLSLSKCEWSTPGDEARQKSGCLKNVGINSMSRSAVNESGVISRFAGKFVAANANAPETAAGVVWQCWQICTQIHGRFACSQILSRCSWDHRSGQITELADSQANSLPPGFFFLANLLRHSQDQQSLVDLHAKSQQPFLFENLLQAAEHCQRFGRGSAFAYAGQWIHV